MGSPLFTVSLWQEESSPQKPFLHSRVYSDRKYEVKLAFIMNIRENDLSMNKPVTKTSLPTHPVYTICSTREGMQYP